MLSSYPSALLNGFMFNGQVDASNSGNLWTWQLNPNGSYTTYSWTIANGRYSQRQAEAANPNNAPKFNPSTVPRLDETQQQQDQQSQAQQVNTRLQQAEVALQRIWNNLSPENRKRLRNDERRWIKRKDSIGSVSARAEEVENRSSYLQQFATR